LANIDGSPNFIGIHLPTTAKPIISRRKSLLGIPVSSSAARRESAGERFGGPTNKLQADGPAIAGETTRANWPASRR
jgi:hypothetical protein